MEEIRWHFHHIIPVHMGGTNNPSNLIKVNTAMHAFLHKCLWEEYDNHYDYIAWKCLSSQITNEEANIMATKHANRGNTYRKGRPGTPSTRKGVPRSEEDKRKISEGTKRAMVGTNCGAPKGTPPWNKGKKGVQQSTRKGTKQPPHSEETKRRISESLRATHAKRTIT